MARTQRVYVSSRARLVTVGDVSINAGTMRADPISEMQLVRIEGKRVAGAPPLTVPDYERPRVTSTGRRARFAVAQYPREREMRPVNGRPARNAATFCMAIGAADCGSVEAATWGSTVICGSDQNGWSAGSGSWWKTSNTA